MDLIQLQIRLSRNNGSSFSTWPMWYRDQLAAIAPKLISGGEPAHGWAGALGLTLQALAGYNMLKQGNRGLINQANAAASYAPGVSPGAGPSGTGAPVGDSGDYRARVRQLESGGNDRDITGNNYGRYQFSFGQYGINRNNWQDPAAQENALSQEIADHTNQFQKRFGRTPTQNELYLMHQQGAAGGLAITSADPNTPAWRVIRRFYESDAIAVMLQVLV
jgi:hypothetical protein